MQRSDDLAAKQVNASQKFIKTWKTQTEGIEQSELQTRKAAGKSPHCAWAKDRKGSHETTDCFG